MYFPEILVYDILAQPRKSRADCDENDNLGRKSNLTANPRLALAHKTTPQVIYTVAIRSQAAA
jgi:hypothetical protein